MWILTTLSLRIYRDGTRYYYLKVPTSCSFTAGPWASALHFCPALKFLPLKEAPTRWSLEFLPALESSSSYLQKPRRATKMKSCLKFLKPQASAASSQEARAPLSLGLDSRPWSNYQLGYWHQKEKAVTSRQREPKKSSSLNPLFSKWGNGGKGWWCVSSFSAPHSSASHF